MAASCRILRLSNFCSKMTLCAPMKNHSFLVSRYTRRLFTSTSSFSQSDASIQQSSVQSPGDTTADHKDEPVEMDNPYTKPHKKCIICQYNIEPDYKNVQLLSQFVSPFSGRIYGRHITGLCTPMQRRIARLIKQAQKNGFMPYLFKETVYLKDPKLYDPFARITHPPDQDKPAPKYQTFFERKK